MCSDQDVCLPVQKLYKTQVRELKEELEEKLTQYSDLERDFKNLENERSVNTEHPQENS